MAFFARRRRRITRRRKVSIVRQFVYGTLAIAVVVGLGYVTWYLTRLPQVTIANIDVEGGETIEHDDIRRIVESNLVGNHVLLVPKHFAYTYPHDEIVEAVKEIPRIYNVQLERASRTTLRVTFDEYLPDALWCTSLTDTASCLFLTDRGYAFTESPQLKGGAFIRYINQQSEPQINSMFSGESTLSYAYEFIRILDVQRSLRVASVVLTKDGDIEFHLSGGGTILTAPGITVVETFENLQSIFESEEYRHLEPGNFNYIDLRFGNKVFVKEAFDVASTTDEVVEEVI